MFVYFMAHIPLTLLMDLVPVYPWFIQAFIKPLRDFLGKPCPGCILSERQRKREKTHALALTR